MKQVMRSRSKNGRHARAEFLHEPVAGEQHKRLAVGLPHEVLDPMFERIGVSGRARVGHFLRDENLHLALVIEGRADLELRGRLGADSLHEIFQRRSRGVRSAECRGSGSRFGVSALLRNPHF